MGEQPFDQKSRRTTSSRWTNSSWRRQPARYAGAAMADAYDPQAVEKKWQERWAEEGTYEIDNDDPRPPYYVLCMYPYPSGPAHQGHVRNYTFGDLLVRQRTMQGYGVLSPIGFDSFGLPAENAAIKTGTHPRIFSDARIDELKASLKALGAVYDWRHERAQRRRGRKARPGAVVLPYHRLRRRTACGSGRAGMARAGQDHAAQL